ncbi:MAG: hypothetical protein NZ519_03380 [Bacteroidia bacterium]|nr:hypothetical protein [Bacteroidia bacterium]MDW8301036.1 hypothetical protein [Bacteroidia bacterium]
MSIGCKKKNTLEPIDSRTQQICKKWRIIEYHVNNVSVKLPPDDYIQFNTNKTYMERKYKVTVSGTWQWQNAQTEIVINSGTWKILTLSNHHLEMEKMNDSPPQKYILHVF